MKNLLIGLLTLGTSSAFAADCNVTVKGLEISKKMVSSILESKGYVVTYLDAQFSIEGANYMGPGGESIKIINMFEKGKDTRIAYVEKNLSFFRGSKKLEKSFLKSLPDCR
jgi:hypothetical protein